MSDTTANEPATGPKAERVDPRLLELLVCPVTKSTLIYDADGQELISRQAQLAFPIKSGVPLMTLDAARNLGTSPNKT